MEEWRDFDNRYEVSSNGNVRNKHTNLILKLSLTGSGYLSLMLYRKSVNVHRIIAKIFIENPNNYAVVNHKNGIKTDNSIENLEWVTSSENQTHSYKTGLKVSKKGTEHGLSVLKEASVIEIKELIKAGISQKEIAKLFNVSKSAISHISRGATWSHL